MTIGTSKVLQLEASSAQAVVVDSRLKSVHFTFFAVHPEEQNEEVAKQTPDSL